MISEFGVERLLFILERVVLLGDERRIFIVVGRGENGR